MLMCTVPAPQGLISFSIGKSDLPFKGSPGIIESIALGKSILIFCLGIDC